MPGQVDDVPEQRGARLAGGCGQTAAWPGLDLGRDFGCGDGQVGQLAAVG
jgi:hypothetical protein